MKTDLNLDYPILICFLGIIGTLLFYFYSIGMIKPILETREKDEKIIIKFCDELKQKEKTEFLKNLELELCK